MIQYYNADHVLKQFSVESFVKLFTKHLKFKHYKLSSHWVESFRVLEWINDQAYHLALLDKYAWLYDMFSIQLLEIYYCQDDDKSLMTMSDLEDLQDKWEIEEVLNHWQIKNTVHYLIKWTTWSSEYNFYESVAHLTKTLETVAAFEQKLKHKQNEFKNAISDKQAHHTDWFDIDFDFDFDFVQTLSE